MEATATAKPVSAVQRQIVSIAFCLTPHRLNNNPKAQECALLDLLTMLRNEEAKAIWIKSCDSGMSQDCRLSHTFFEHLVNVLIDFVKLDLVITT
jgi:hypothetical protein